MRERNRATKRFQDACHAQYAQRSPVVLLTSPRHHSNSTVAQGSSSSRGGSALSGGKLRNHSSSSILASAATQVGGGGAPGAVAALADRWDEEDAHDDGTAAAAVSVANIRDPTPSPRRPQTQAVAAVSPTIQGLHGASSSSGLVPSLPYNNIKRNSPSMEVYESEFVRVDTVDVVASTSVPFLQQQNSVSPRAAHVPTGTPRGGSRHLTTTTSPRGGHPPTTTGISPRRTQTVTRVVHDLENDELWQRIRELREALVSRDELLEQSNERVVRLKRQERDLSSSIVQSALRHAEALILLTKQRRESSEPQKLSSSSASDEDEETANEAREKSNSPLSRTGSDDVWWKCPLFSEREQIVLDDIRRRKTAASIIADESI
nr:Hypothetical protein, putative [Bodo saltans]|eukprot:CUG85364.1 Hypothetical protein, putative [Bodo saltans]